MKQSILVKTVLFFFLFQNLIAQPAIEWEKSLGGSNADYGQSIQQTNDGGYIVAGQSRSNDGHVGGNNGNGDAWIVKLDNSGGIEWEKNYGGSDLDNANFIQQTMDNGYIFTGFIKSSDGDVSGNNGEYDFWVVKLNETGVLQWEKNFGDAFSDEPSEVHQTNDGGFIVSGSTTTIDPAITGVDITACLTIKLDESGNVEWQKELSTFDQYDVNSIQQTDDDGYILAGASHMVFLDSFFPFPFPGDYWLAKLDNTGNLEWEKTYGGSQSDQAHAIQQTADGGYIFLGHTVSEDGDVLGTPNNGDYWILKLDNNGDIQWQQLYGGSGADFGLDIKQTTDGGYIATGMTLSIDGDVGGNNGQWDSWVIKLDDTGDLQWGKNMGGSLWDAGNAVQQTTDGGFIVVGDSRSSDGDVSSSQGNYDIWVVKLAACLPDNGITQNGTTLTANATDVDYQWVDCDNNNSPISNETNQSFTPLSAGSYAVQIMSGDCTLLSPCVEWNLDNITETENEYGIRIFPNIVTDEFHIHQKDVTKMSIKIMDSIGSVLTTTSSRNKQKTINISTLPEGTYFVIIQIDNKIVTEQIVKLDQ